MEIAGTRSSNVAGRSRFTLRSIGALLLLMGAAALLLARAASGPTGGETARAATDAMAKLPLSFIPNRGQVDAETRFYAQGAGYAFGFTRRGVSLDLSRGRRATALRLSFVGAARTPAIEADSPLPGKVNYLRGEGAASYSNLPTYGEIRYREVWPGIDMAVRGQGGTLKYEFHVRPGADVRDIGLAYSGAQGLSTSADGGLLVHTGLGVLRDKPPVSYQVVDGKRVPVASQFALRPSAGGYGFAVGRHDPARPLVIDPGLVYSTFLGEQTVYGPSRIAADAQGNAYLAGTTISSDTRTTPGAYDTSLTGRQDVFVSKLNRAGTGLVYSTYIGGSRVGTSSENDRDQAIAVDAAGSAYLLGTTDAQDFPTTPGAYDGATSSSAAFVAKLNPSGSALDYSALIVDTSELEQAFDIAVDSAGSAYVGVTTRGSIATTPGAFDTEGSFGIDVGLIKLNPAGSALDYATYVAGQDQDNLGSVAVDRDGNAVITGNTYSTDFPTTPGAFQTTFPSSYGSLTSESAFVTKVNAAGSDLVYSTYLGARPRGTLGQGVAVDASGSAYVTGMTRASTFPTTPGAYDRTFNNNGGSAPTDAFVTKFGPSGSLSYSTFLGTTAFAGMDIGVDRAGNAVVAGMAGDPPFPTTPGAFDTTGDNTDLFVAKLNTTGSALSYSTFLGGEGIEQPGGLAVDGDGNAIVSGLTRDRSFQTTPGALDSTYNAFPTQSFVAKLDLLPTGFLFGSGDAGGQFSAMSANTKRASPFTVFANATVRRLHAYIDGGGATSGSQTLRAVLYRNAGGQPAARVAQSFDVTVNAGDPGHWQPFYLAPPANIGPGVYWLGLQSGGTNGVARFAWSAKPGSRRFNIDSFADGPSDPFGASTADEQQLSIYAGGSF